MTEHFEPIRRHATEIPNAVIEDYLGGRIDRREFLRAAAVLGMTAAFSSGLAPRGARAA